MKRQTGYTLIEIMVALTIFALMAAIAYRGLDAVLTAAGHVERDGAKWRSLGIAFAMVEQSLGSALDVAVRDADGNVAAAFMGLGAVRREDEALLAFTRTGFPGHGGALADIQRAGFRVKDGRLEQLLWPAPDAAPRSEPLAVELLAGVESLALRYLARDGSWHPAWPPSPEHPALPAATELSLRLTGGEQLTRMFALP
jgi:general secretion pathway protein J